MNKLKALIVLGMSWNAGFYARSSIWNPKTGKMIVAIIYGVIAVVTLFTIKEAPEPTDKPDSLTDNANNHEMDKSI